MDRFRVRLIEGDHGRDATWEGAAETDAGACDAARGWLRDLGQNPLDWHVVEVLRLGAPDPAAAEAHQRFVEELTYCTRALDDRGSREVPREALHSYLEVQQASAQRAGLPAFAEAFRRAGQRLRDRGATDSACDEAADVLGIALEVARAGRVHWACEVTTAGDRGAYSRNALVFGMREEAEAYGLDLALRWTAVVDWRPVAVLEQVNYRWDGARAVTVRREDV